MTVHGSRTLIALCALILQGALTACRERDSAHVVDVSLSNSEVYEYPIGVGDETGPRIAVQASHYNVSELRSTASFDYVHYVYQAAAGFVGTDEATIEVVDYCCGPTAPRTRDRLTFRFSVHD